MKSTNEFRIAVFPGDGIGAEITAPTLDLLDSVSRQIRGFSLAYEHCDAGAASYLEQGTDLPEASVKTADAADAILLAAMGLPSVRKADGSELVPQIDLRMIFELYAGVRPVKPIPGVRPVLADERSHAVDYVILRESTEGLFARQAPGTRDGDQEARETMVITRPVCEKLFGFALNLAEERNTLNKVTSVDKANVFPAFTLWREILAERAALKPAIEVDHAYVDAFAMTMVQKPWSIDVAVTENMFGDILSDLGAALMGGMGYAPSADIGDNHAVFQPCHGSAPDIAGTGIANPTAMILSAAMMLDWLGKRKGSTEAARAAKALRAAVDAAFADGDLITCELGGSAGTSEVFAAVGSALERIET